MYSIPNSSMSTWFKPKVYQQRTHLGLQADHVLLGSAPGIAVQIPELLLGKLFMSSEAIAV